MLGKTKKWLKCRIANRSALVDEAEPSAENENKLPGPARSLFGSKNETAFRPKWLDRVTFNPSMCKVSRIMNFIPWNRKIDGSGVRRRLQNGAVLTAADIAGDIAGRLRLPGYFC
jgi:hypothetical protein